MRRRLSYFVGADPCVRPFFVLSVQSAPPYLQMSRVGARRTVPERLSGDRPVAPTAGPGNRRGESNTPEVMYVVGADPCVRPFL